MFTVEEATIWLQTRAVTASGRKLDTCGNACAALAEHLTKEYRRLDQLQSTHGTLITSARLSSLFALFNALAHLPATSACMCRGRGVRRLYICVLHYFCVLLARERPEGLPFRMRLAQALLRVLQGCSRQLASLSDAVKAAVSTSQTPPMEAASHPADLLSLACVLGKLVTIAVRLTCDLSLLANACPPHQLEAESPVRVVAPGGNSKKGQQGAEVKQESEDAPRTAAHGRTAGQQAPSTASEAGRCQEVSSAQRLAAAELPAELVVALASSGVLEHASRTVLVLGRYLQDGRDCPKGQGGAPSVEQVQQQQLAHDVRNAAGYVGTIFYNLTTLTHVPGFLDGDYAAAAPGSQAAPGGVSAPAGRAPAPLAPLGARHRALAAAHVSLLRRVLSSPCARHLALCRGLSSLCALDGGSTCGVPEEAGLQHLSVEPLGGVADPKQQENQHNAHTAALLNLLFVLAMRPCDPAGQEAEPPGRASRLQLTLRMARAAASAASAASTSNGSGGVGVGGSSSRSDGSGGGGGSSCGDSGGVGGSGGTGRDGGSGSASCFVVGALNLYVAVQALHLAWRHVPAPRGPDGGRRRHAVLRQWAATAELVARRGVATAGHTEVLHRLGLLLGLHPSMVGPVSREDLPVLATGGHLLRAAEVLVRRFADEEEQGAGADRGQPTACPDARTQSSKPTASYRSAVAALAADRFCGAGMCSRALLDLWLQRGDDQQPGEREGAQVHGEGASGPGEAAVRGSGASGMRDAASLAVALGKLLWRYEGRLVAALGSCCDEQLRHVEQLGHDHTLVEVLAAVYDGCALRETAAPFAYRGPWAVDSREGGGGGVGRAGAAPQLGGSRVRRNGNSAGGEAGANEEVDNVEGGDGAGVLQGNLNQQEEKVRHQHQRAALGAGQLGQQQAYEQEEQQYRVLLVAYGAWRWLPALASLARRTAAARHINDHSLRVWQLLLVWASRLCRHYYREEAGRVEGLSDGVEPGSVSGVVAAGGSSGGAGLRTAGAGDGADERAASGEEQSGRAVCSGDGGGRGRCSCWREFLLQDVGLKELLGCGLGVLVPELAAGALDQYSKVLWDIACVCVRAVAAFPHEVGCIAWGVPSGEAGRKESSEVWAGSGGDGGGDSSGSNGSSNTRSAGSVWHIKMLSVLAESVEVREGTAHVAQALRAVAEWGGQCVSSGMVVGLSGEQRHCLAVALDDIDRHGWCQVPPLPPLCEVRALLHVCSNPRCAVLPPRGRTEAEAAAEAERLAACPKGCGAVRYCCTQCREEHGRSEAGGEALCRS